MLNKLKTFAGIAIISAFLLALAPGTVYASTIGYVVGNRVNVRSSGEIADGNRLFQVGHGEVVDIYDVSDDFFRVSVADRNSVYIAREWVRVSETKGVVTDQVAWIYNIPVDKGGYRLTTVSAGEVLTVTSTYGNWYGIDFWGDTAFVSKSNVEIPSFVDLPTARIRSNNGKADDIINFAFGYLGARHVLGGNGPNVFDCSGFMTYILRPFGISVNRHSGDMARNGVHVDRHEIERGDLLFFATSGRGRISHVGMYIGDNEFIHASSWRSGVRVDRLNDPYYVRNFVTARRVI